jgi:hypothetical protein
VSRTLMCCNISRQGIEGPDWKAGHDHLKLH